MASARLNSKSIEEAVFSIKYCSSFFFDCFIVDNDNYTHLFGEFLYNMFWNAWRQIKRSDTV